MLAKALGTAVHVECNEGLLLADSVEKLSAWTAIMAAASHFARGGLVADTIICSDDGFCCLNRVICCHAGAPILQPNGG